MAEILLYGRGRVVLLYFVGKLNKFSGLQIILQPALMLAIMVESKISDGFTFVIYDSDISITNELKRTYKNCTSALRGDEQGDGGICRVLW